MTPIESFIQAAGDDMRRAKVMVRGWMHAMEEEASNLPLKSQD